MRMSRRAWWTVSGLTVALLAGVYWLTPRPLPVDLAVVRETPLTVTVDEEGSTRVRRHEDVNAPVSGRFVPAGVRVGDSTPRGTVLGTMLPTPLDQEARRVAESRVVAAVAAVRAAEARLRSSVAAYEEATQVYTRRERLAGAGGLSTEDLEQARLAMTSAREAREAADASHRAAIAERNAASSVLDVRRDGVPGQGLVLRAPMNGVLMRLVEEHERVVASGMTLAQVGDPSDVELVIPVLTDEAPQIHVGAAVQYTTGVGTTPARAVVTRVEPAAYTKLSPLGVAEQRVNVIAQVSPPLLGLGDGYRVDAHITVAHVPRAIVVPVGALIRESNGWRVWLVRGGRAESRTLRLGQRSTDHAEVLSGLAPGDTVVLYPPETLEAGTRLTGGSTGTMR